MFLTTSCKVTFYSSPYMQPGLPQRWFLHRVHTRTRDTQTAACRHQRSQRRCGCHGQHQGRWESVPDIPTGARHRPARSRAGGLKTVVVNSDLSIMVTRTLPPPSTETGLYLWRGSPLAPSHPGLLSSWCFLWLCLTPPYLQQNIFIWMRCRTPDLRPDSSICVLLQTLSHTEDLL